MVQRLRLRAAMLGDHLHASVVEERDAAVLLEQVVAGVGVGIEHPAHEVALEDEAPQRLGVGASCVLAVAHDVLETATVHELAGQDARCGPLGHQPRNADGRIALVDERESDQPLGLEGVVELLAEARPQRRELTLRVEATRAEDGTHAFEDPGVREIAVDRLLDAGVLHLHRDLDAAHHALGEPRAMDLADRGAGDRDVVERVEEPIDGRAELVLDDSADLRSAGARGLGAQDLQRRLERIALRLGHEPVDVARHLPDLRSEATHGAEHIGGAIGCRFPAVIVTMRGEDRAGSSLQPERSQTCHATEPSTGNLVFHA